MDPIRPPDSTRHECLLGSNTPPRRRRRRATTTPSSSAGASAAAGATANITWDEEDTTAFSHNHKEEEDALLRLAMEVSLREEQERAVEAAEASLREEMARQEAKRVEECQQKFGLVQSRLRLMRHPSDPLVDTWLELMELYPKGMLPTLSEGLHKDLQEWLEKRTRSSPIWNVLGDLLI